jgi:2-polyprenyl-3-methyl-5-hydroxy-6-metoxy-1,4-benzoquinol methylase
MYRDVMPRVDVLAPYAQLGLGSSTERQQRLGFHVVVCMACVHHAPSPAHLFIEHANGLCHHRPNSTLIRLESNPCEP